MVGRRVLRTGLRALAADAWALQLPSALKLDPVPAMRPRRCAEPTLCLGGEVWPSEQRRTAVRAPLSPPELCGCRKNNWGTHLNLAEAARPGAESPPCLSSVSGAQPKWSSTCSRICPAALGGHPKHPTHGRAPTGVEGKPRSVFSTPQTDTIPKHRKRPQGHSNDNEHHSASPKPARSRCWRSC